MEHFMSMKASKCVSKSDGAKNGWQAVLQIYSHHKWIIICCMPQQLLLMLMDEINEN